MADTETKQPTQEKQTNCLTCNKPIRKKKKYYRNGKYYCSKKCYKTLLAKEAKKDESK
ncbi:MAG: hypothetical protein Q8L26_06055 [Candidatus Omnitrophota bacterium]|nr:hypothetical protein [Candidatus Omnitrophota bacterium]